MGIFSKAPERAAASQSRIDAHGQKMMNMARTAAQKKRLNVDGALAVGHTLMTEFGEQFLLVFPDRIDLVSAGKPGILGRPGRGTETIPVSRVSSVECRTAGIACSFVDVHTSGNSLTFKSNRLSGPQLRQIILDLVVAHEATPTASAPQAEPVPDVTEQLRKLGELHVAGILTDAEFSAKKTELLIRL